MLYLNNTVDYSSEKYTQKFPFFLSESLAILID